MSLPVMVLNGWAASEAAWSRCAFARRRVYSDLEQLDGVAARDFDATGRVVLVGWSMGGSGALRLLLREPRRVAGLVLLAATPRMMAAEGWRGMSERRLAALEAGFRLTQGRGLLGLPDGWPNPYRTDETPANLARGLAYLRETDLRAELEARRAAFFDIPVRIFQSARDGIVRAENAAYLAGLFPRAEVETLPGSEHVLPLLIPSRLTSAIATLAG